MCHSNTLTYSFSRTSIIYNLLTLCSKVEGTVCVIVIHLPIVSLVQVLLTIFLLFVAKFKVQYVS